MRILLLTGYYLPGFKGGGPIRTIANLLDKLNSEFKFALLTSDRDLGDSGAYQGITPDQWQEIDGIKINYASPGPAWPLRLWRTISNFQGDALHLNSFFSFRFSILPLLMWRLLKRGKPICLGPRGEFSAGALQLKSGKKRAFLLFAKTLGLYRSVVWHASTPHEAQDIRRVMGQRSIIRIAVNIACPPVVLSMAPRIAGAPLKLVFLSRISPMKNLLGAIELLRDVSCPVEFDVYGPPEDQAYWRQCQQAASRLPPQVQFRFQGAIYPAQVPEVLAKHDLFLLPTLGENFGHVIAEALGCGLPVLISDATPWRQLEAKRLGWDIPLNQAGRFVQCIEDCARLPSEAYDAWRREIRAWALQNIGNDEAVEQSRQLFKGLITHHDHTFQQ